MVEAMQETESHHHHSHHHHHHHKIKSILSSHSMKLGFSFLGIFVAYLLFGITQESIVKGKYGEHDKFTYIISLVLFQCIFNAIVSKTILVLRKTPQDSTPSRMYAFSAFTYLFAMLASNFALEFVSYPMQVLGKSVKPVPVMLLGVLVARKRYPLMKYVYVSLIVIGVILFMYKKPKETNTVDTGDLIGIGEFLLFVSLVFDGLTGGIQDKIRDKHRVQAYHMMYSMNIWSCLWASIGILVTGEIFGLYNFLTLYPYVIVDMFLLGLAGAVGQNFIFLTIEWFGPLTCSIFTTTRKFFTILCSIVIFGNAITKQQMLGTALVFAGLFLEQLYGKKKHN
ncbi:unnamed protein product [Rotaria magnacalcarata]|uniref:Solute carrier family 35 member B1 n=5 Tax=Rotaria magnacalcarata TaxID=392030 RepID=A0A819T0J0_9BILA|nr:unnamed protein product [Rotaria magnacalcarata]CAF1294542.1 unnamed protein product [Rotaria magnacalcarata]CAF1936718.1 unnamed protein product [Rotaria magnacalcarata]CAF1945863.1 unnamed protein product [Rotaria magnacalcarata]CAF3902716.1 unnamed protein product [Rotaria magnacalcarata]